MAADGRGTRALPAPRGGAAWLRARLCLCEQRAESERDRAAFCAHPGWPFETLDGLHEHERRRAGFVQGGIDGLVAQLFARPDELVFGDETANQAAARLGARGRRRPREQRRRSLRRRPSPRDRPARRRSYRRRAAAALTEARLAVLRRAVAAGVAPRGSRSLGLAKVAPFQRASSVAPAWRRQSGSLCVRAQPAGSLCVQAQPARPRRLISSSISAT